MYQKNSQFLSSFLLWIQDRPYPIWPKLTTIWRMKIYVPHGFVVTNNLCGAIFVERAPISYYAHVTLAYVNCKLRKIVSKDDLHNQRAARKGIGVKLALPPRFLYARSRREIQSEREKKGLTVITSFARQNSRGPYGSAMKTVRKRKKRIV